MPCHSILVFKVSAEKSADNSLMGFPLYITRYLSFAAFKILSLTYIIFIIMCLSVDLCGFNLFGNVWGSGALMSGSFPRLGRFSAIFSSRKFYGPLSLFHLGPLKCECYFCLMLSQSSLKVSLLFKILFFFLLL